MLVIAQFSRGRQTGKLIFAFERKQQRASPRDQVFSVTKSPPRRLSHLQFHVGEVVTCLQKTTLVPGGAEVLLYSTINGSIGALLPFKSRSVPSIVSLLAGPNRLHMFDHPANT